MGERILKLENITDEKWNEMLSTGWRLMSVDNFFGDQLVYSFQRVN